MTEASPFLLPDLLRAAGGDPLVWALAGLAGALLFALGAGVGALLAAGRARRSSEHFAAVAAEALDRNNAGFLALAAERFQRLEDAAESDWDARRKSVETTVAPLREALERYRAEAQASETRRAEQSGELGEQLRGLATETTRLATALRGPAARGRWGELTLRRTAELAGLREHCDFAEQVTVGRAGAVQRPDMLVRLPGGRELAVDAKAPLDAYWTAAEAASEEERKTALADHARQVRRHVDALAGRDYAARLDDTLAFVVLFLPDEGFLGAAVSHDAGLVEHALGKGVVLATPATLFALLGAVARGWREVRLGEDTREALAQARELEERLGVFVDHFSKVGASLGKSVEAFNKAVGSFEARVLPQTRRLRELGSKAPHPAPTPERVALAVRAPAGGAAEPT
ncbi:MAG: DNA recombination protein RmuC [Myxococcota bacterium]